MNTLDPKRYVINNVDALLRILHADPRYALDFRNKAEQHITLKLRKKFFNASPDGVVDAFNNALMKFLQARTFRDEGFLAGQPAEGWSAHELALGKLGGYLYRGSLHELIQAHRRIRQEVQWKQPAQDDLLDDNALDEIETLSDPSPFADPARAYEHLSVIRRMRACLDKLSDTLRATMFLYLDETPMEQIARLQDLHVPTVKSRLHAARKLVADCTRKGMD
ncbi:RNA polymerase sigma factor [Achromobacter arsenitoxydans]|uniref:ECF subfamily RNA polymerase sigma-24 subunit n=1 Tax=Achromobacter arsenitoxydans SY8 TaxID=477184 RepID=H0FD38_9BURK|nr:sigma factor-like helix-turn-helix DNA-binding protein [Achromobacter arsenitoxydans]EHK63831.1 ECF subfamily RNA polymerase sigma-24 subunit [Achromobacter arsenitoxydans SY8]